MTVSAFIPNETLHIRLSCPEATVAINQLRMVRAVVNLLENAQRAIDKDTGEIRLSAESEDGYVRICVVDNGIGMEQKQLNQALYVLEGEKERASMLVLGGTHPNAPPGIWPTA